MLPRLCPFVRISETCMITVTLLHVYLTNKCYCQLCSFFYLNLIVFPTFFFSFRGIGKLLKLVMKMYITFNLINHFVMFDQKPQKPCYLNELLDIIMIGPTLTCTTYISSPVFTGGKNHDFYRFRTSSNIHHYFI